MHQGQGQEVEDRGGVQSTVQHDGGGLELEDIAGQCRMTRQTVLQGGNAPLKPQVCVGVQRYRYSKAG